MKANLGFVAVCSFAAILLVITSLAMAAPTTGAATLVGSNNVTVAMTGASGTCWFEWGMQTGNNMTWRTPNATPSGGLWNTTIKGSPLIGSTLFYYRACDTSGCGSSSSFTTAAVTPIPTRTYGATFENLTSNNFDVTMLGGSTMIPYTWLVPGFEALIWGLIWMGILIGLWLRGRDLGYLCGLGIIIGVLLFSPTYGLNIGIPEEFATFGQGILYASIAGVLLSIIKK